MRNKGLLLVVTLVTLFLGGCEAQNIREHVNSLVDQSTTEVTKNREFSVEYDGGYQEIVVNDNIPDFTSDDLSLNAGAWQTFSDLDHLNRVEVANALIGKESFPTEKREGLTVKPTGWHQKRLDDGQWLYNGCHLIGFQLTGENDNPKNLMTGTRILNTPQVNLKKYNNRK